MAKNNRRHKFDYAFGSSDFTHLLHFTCLAQILAKCQIGLSLFIHFFSLPFNKTSTKSGGLQIKEIGILLAYLFACHNFFIR